MNGPAAPWSGELLARDFAVVSDLLRAHARERPDVVALVDDTWRIGWRALDALVDRIALGLQRDGTGKGDVVALLGPNSIPYAAAMLATVRIGAVAVPLMTSASPATLDALIEDCRPTHLFLAGDHAVVSAEGIATVALDDRAGGAPLEKWSPTEGTPAPVEIAPSDPFNIIYSSGTTGAPKGIVQSHAMRWSHVRRGLGLGYDTTSVTINSTPLYSNTTLVSFLPTLAAGGRVVLISKFDARRFLEVAERERATHAALVPVQIRRILASPAFDSTDLSSFRLKTCTSAPFDPALKRETLERWPGGLVEIYGLTEGGASCVLRAHERPDKLHTVGTLGAGNELRLIDAEGREVAPGATGEVVGRGPAMMTGYHRRPDESAAAEWFDGQGRRFVRHGDVGRLDEEGFLILVDRVKDVIISGGFNIYPSDVEAALLACSGVREAAVVGMPDAEWGETPVGFVVLNNDADLDAVRACANAGLGRTQRIRALHAIDRLPRSAIGKVMKRELADRARRVAGGEGRAGALEGGTT